MLLIILNKLMPFQIIAELLPSTVYIVSHFRVYLTCYKLNCNEGGIVAFHAVGLV